MIYNKFNKVKRALVAACLLPLGTCLFSGCSDFLDILPMNEVVLENYWTQKSDVTSVLNGCYETLEHTDCITRMGIWGELRSDNLRLGSSVPNEINEILKENLIPTNPYCNWGKFYEAINRCNTVIYYAPDVQAIDPNYSMAEMQADIAEAKCIRALCYFYLIRTFRDVPYSTEPSIDDTKTYVVAATPFNKVLQNLINDLESCKDQALRRYYPDDSPNAYQNSSRITRCAIYALLADLYLWANDWDHAIENCNRVIDFKKQQYKEMREREGNVNTIGLFAGIPLLLEKPSGSNVCGNAYTEIFGVGNSFESIFELYFATNQSQENTWVNTYYGNRNSTMGRLSMPDFLRKEVPQGTNSIFKKTDGRAYACAEVIDSRYAIAKYVRTSYRYSNQSISTEASLNASSSVRSSANANWIIYRLTDMLLIKAEAMIERGEGTDYEDAFTLINAVNKRSNDVTTTTRTDTLKMADYVKNDSTSRLNLEELLFEERQREFLFEGKRWFDLVRMARRDGNNTRLVTLASRKYIENVNAIKIKLANPDIIYFPYAKSELKVNPLLKQNSAYGNTETSVIK